MLLILDGSICSGKSTFKNALLKSGTLLRHFDIYAPHFYLCHLTSYVVLRILYRLRLDEQKPAGNYITSLAILDKEFFRKILLLLELLDIFNLCVVYSIKILRSKLVHMISSRDKMLIILGDEFGLTPLAEYLSYNTRYSNEFFSRVLYRFLWAIFVHYIKKFDLTCILFFRIPLKNSIIFWMKREETEVADVKHLALKPLIIKSLLQHLSGLNLEKSKARIRIFEVTCNNPKECFYKAKNILFLLLGGLSNV